MYHIRKHVWMYVCLHVYTTHARSLAHNRTTHAVPATATHNRHTYSRISICITTKCWRSNCALVWDAHRGPRPPHLQHTYIPTYTHTCIDARLCLLRSYGNVCVVCDIRSRCPNFVQFGVILCRRWLPSCQRHSALSDTSSAVPWLLLVLAFLRCRRRRRRSCLCWCFAVVVCYICAYFLVNHSN